MRTLLHGISLRRKLLFLQGISLIFTILSLIFILRIEYYGEIGSIAERSDQIAEQAASRAAQLYHEQETITLFPLLREANGTPNATMNVLLGNTEGPVLSYQEIRTLETEMMNVLSLNSTIDSIAVVNMAGTGMFMDLTRTYNRSETINLGNEQPWMRRVLDAKGTPVLLTGEIGLPDGDQIYAARAIIYAEKYMPVGFVVAGISIGDIQRILERNLILADQRAALLEIPSGDMIYSSLPLGFSLALDQPWRIIEDGYMLSFALSEDGRFLTLIATPYLTLLRSISIPSIVILLLAVAFTIFMAVFSRMIIRSIQSSVSHIISSVRKLGKGDFSVRIEDLQSPEMQEIGTALNSMSDEISNLIQTVYKKNLEMKESELQVLRSQINRHFLYNTLDSARMTAYRNSDRTVYQILTELSELLKYGLTRSNDLVTLSNEVENVRHYVLISNIRSQGEITLNTVIEGSLSLRLPRITLQPIIENSIIHGFDRGRLSGTITIFAYRSGRTSVITIADDGEGMDRERLEEVRGRLLRMDDGELQEGHIGLGNIRRRLSLIFPDRCSMELNAVEGKGCSVTITIEDEDDGDTDSR